jgi:hypothetical protein
MMAQGLGENISRLFLGGNILQIYLSCIQHCSLVMALHIKAFGQFMELGVARECNGRVVVRH